MASSSLACDEIETRLPPVAPPPLDGACSVTGTAVAIRAGAGADGCGVSGIGLSPVGGLAETLALAADFLPAFAALAGGGVGAAVAGSAAAWLPPVTDSVLIGRGSLFGSVPLALAICDGMPPG